MSEPKTNIDLESSPGTIPEPFNGQGLGASDHQIFFEVLGRLDAFWDYWDVPTPIGNVASIAIASIVLILLLSTALSGVRKLFVLFRVISNKRLGQLGFVNFNFGNRQIERELQERIQEKNAEISALEQEIRDLELKILSAKKDAERDVYSLKSKLEDLGLSLSKCLEEKQDLEQRLQEQLHTKEQLSERVRELESFLANPVESVPIEVALLNKLAIGASAKIRQSDLSQLEDRYHSIRDVLERSSIALAGNKLHDVKRKVDFLLERSSAYGSEELALEAISCVDRSESHNEYAKYIRRECDVARLGFYSPLTAAHLYNTYGRYLAKNLYYNESIQAFKEAHTLFSRAKSDQLLWIPVFNQSSAYILSGDLLNAKIRSDECVSELSKTKYNKLVAGRQVRDRVDLISREFKEKADVDILIEFRQKFRPVFISTFASGAREIGVLLKSSALV